MDNILKNSVKTATNILKQEFGEIPIYDTSVIDGYQTPCFFIEIVNFTKSKSPRQIYNINIDMNIIYIYSNDTDNQIESLEKTEQITDTFLTKEFKLNELISTEIKEITAEINNENITVTFSLNFDIIEELTEEELNKIDNMDTLYFNKLEVNKEG